MGVLLLTITLLAGQMPLSERPLAMKEAEACRLEFVSAADTSGGGDWGGQIALYDAETNQDGILVTLRRRIIEDREHLPKRVRLDQLEDCLRKWKFDGGGAFTIRLIGGPSFVGFWVIDVRRDARAFRLRFPVTVAR